MENSNINSIQLSKLDRIKLENGDVLHGLKNSETSFKGFGEAYFSLIKYKKIKAWKKHREMTLNLIVPFGMVKVGLIDSKNRKKELTIGEENYYRLTVPPNIWFGFQGISKTPSLVLNLANLPHDPAEVERKMKEEIYFNWQKDS